MTYDKTDFTNDCEDQEAKQEADNQRDLTEDKLTITVKKENE